MHVNISQCSLRSMINDARKKQSDWLDAVLEATGWSPTTLARKARLHASTLSKFRLADSVSTLTSNSITKIAAISPIPPFETSLPQVARGIAHSEVRLLDLALVTDDLAISALSSVQGVRNSIEIWLLESRALELAGYMPGDYLMVDVAAKPKLGDPVCVRFENPRPGTPDAVVRLFEKPFLVSATMDSALNRPLLIDDSHLKVAGVVVGSYRVQAAA